MLDWQPITTTNVLSIIQIIVVALGFYFSWKSLQAALENLKVSTANAQVQLYNQLVLQGRELQFKFMDIHYPGNSAQDIEKRKDLLFGMVIGYYAASFSLKTVFKLPASVDKLLDAELKDLMRNHAFSQKWEQVRHLHSKEFNVHINSLVGV